jgi:hypothetical protein
VGLKTPDLDQETRTIYELVAALLSGAFWRRAREEPGFSVLEYLRRRPEEYRPESHEEIALWDELTAPRHYRAILRYAEQREDQVNNHYREFLCVLREAARRRWEIAGGNGESAP